MIDHHTWRSLIYRLAEEYPDCLMLNFTIKLISDAGFQSEITSISTAAQQIEVFSRVLKTAITKFLSSPDDVQKTIEECAVCVNRICMLCSIGQSIYFSCSVVHFAEDGVSRPAYLCVQSSAYSGTVSGTERRLQHEAFSPGNHQIRITKVSGTSWHSIHTKKKQSKPNSQLARFAFAVIKMSRRSR